MQSNTARWKVNTAEMENTADNGKILESSDAIRQRKKEEKLPNKNKLKNIIPQTKPSRSFDETLQLKINRECHLKNHLCEGHCQFRFSPATFLFQSVHG